MSIFFFKGISSDVATHNNSCRPLFETMLFSLQSLLIQCEIAFTIASLVALFICILALFRKADSVGCVVEITLAPALLIKIVNWCVCGDDMWHSSVLVILKFFHAILTHGHRFVF